MHKLYKSTFFLILLLISFGSCKTKNKEKKYVVGFSQFTTQDAWHQAMNNSMKMEAQFHNEIELLIFDAKEDVDKQIEDIEKLIDKKVDVLIVSPIAAKPLKSTINKASKSNIPVVILDTQDKEINYKSFIGVDNYKIGENAAKYIASLKTSANIIEIKGWAGTAPTIQRSNGFRDFITQNNELKIIGTAQERYDKSGNLKNFKKLLQENKEVNFIYAHKDFLALKAYEIAKELNLEKKINFIGVGGVNSKDRGLDLVKRNILKASILHPNSGKEALETAVKIINSEEIKKTRLLPSIVIDEKNVDVIKRQSDLILNQELDIEKQQYKITNQIQLYSSQSSFLRYTLLFLALIAGLLLITLLNKRKLNKQKILLEEYILKIADQKDEIEKTAEDLRTTNESTNNFFTGVSHDFKTPISLILSSTESLLTNNNKTKPKEYNLIYNNSKRLLRMINQLLDFKRLENKKIRLQATKTNIHDFTKNIYDDFEKEAIKRNIDFRYTNTNTNNEVYIDKNIFDNILFNLLSNAFKFTPNKGTIHVNLSETDDRIYISVKDSGIGILSSEKDEIFKKFFQGSNNKQNSSGIGLYVTKKYLLQHEGDIEVISAKGEGSEFKLYIPKGHHHFKTTEIIIDDTINDTDTILDINDFTFEEVNTPASFDEEKETLLIIEDNTDLRIFLKNKLSKKYNIGESDGIDAVEKAITLVPDIIISDVNLPEKNGFEITKILKENEKTSHIPILILTALSSSDAHLKGLESGVDMFLTKPFNLAILNQSLKTLSYNRKKLQHFYKQNLTEEKSLLNKTDKETLSPKKLKKKNLEIQFIEKINTRVLENLDNSEFMVETLAEDIHMSRVQLYRKTKAVLGISISDYIQNIRLEKSKELLLNNDLTISDVAYSTGFSSPNYFSTSFKNKYKQTPNQYKKEELLKLKKQLLKNKNS